MSGPITPKQAARGTHIPDAVFDSINARLGGNGGTIDQAQLVAELVGKGLKRSEMFEKHWLDFEDAYRAAGWIVEYDKPGYNESYGAFWRFSKKR